MNEDQLITALKGQDPGAVQELVNTYGQRVHRRLLLRQQVFYDKLSEQK